ncbi:MAG: transporter substrate-binding domain-containing protein [Proteobacteria bacterium]|nr:transporter substrate-binding domain-containing protein [Pseudomonadota bacterium]
MLPARITQVLQALLVCTFLLGSQAQAQSPSHPADPIVMGSLDKGWPPYLFSQDDPRHLGIMVDIFIEASTALDFHVNITWLPEKRAMLDLEQGQIDVYAKAKEWVPSPSLFLWSAPIIYSTDVLIFRAGEDFAFNSPKDLAGKTVGTVLGFRYPRLEKLFLSGTCTRMDANNARTQLKMLLSGRLDTAVVNQLVAQWLIREDPSRSPSQVSFSLTPLDTAAYRYAFSMHRTWGTFIQDLDREIERMRCDGRMKTILDRYR